MKDKSDETKKYLRPHPRFPSVWYNPELDKYADLPPPQKAIEALEELKRFGLPQEYYDEHGPIVNWKEH